MTVPLTIAGVALRRLARDRTAMFFVVILPIVVILVIGLTERGFDRFRVGIVVGNPHGTLSSALVTDLQHAPALETSVFTDPASARTALRRGELVGLVVVPSGYDATALAGRDTTVQLLTSVRNSDQQAVSAAVDGVVARQAAQVQAATYSHEITDAPVGTALTRARGMQASGTVVTVRTELVDRGGSVLPSGFSYSAPTMLVLFVFINAVAGGATIIQTRRLGLYDRALAAPVAVRSIVLGETLASLAVALLQSALIVGVGAVFFGVSWGDPFAAAVLVVTWALVGTGAGVLSGTLFRTPEQASAIGPAIGIAFGMLGGCMWPLEIVSPVMQHVGHLAPQAWAVDAWTALLSRNGDVVTIVRPLTVLGAIAAGLLLLATIRLRRAVSS